MKKYWIYIGKNSEQFIHCNYYLKPLDPIPEHLTFVGTAQISREYFGERVEDKFKIIFDGYVKHKGPDADDVKNAVDRYVRNNGKVSGEDYRLGIEWAIKHFNR